MSQANANTAGVIATALALAVAAVSVWRYAIRRGRKLEAQSVEQAALKKIVDANLLEVVGTIRGTQERMERRQLALAKTLREMRKASRPNGKESEEIGDQVALLKDAVNGIREHLGLGPVEAAGE